MQPDAQARMLSCERRCLSGVRLRNHDAGVRERSSSMVAHDGGIDFGAAPKIVARDDQGFQYVGHAGMVTGR